MGASSLCWYQGSGSLQSSGEREKSTLGPFVVTITVDLKKKKVQRESCELSFIWGKMRTAVRETAFQITEKLL